MSLSLIIGVRPVARHIQSFGTAVRINGTKMELDDQEYNGFDHNPSRSANATLPSPGCSESPPRAFDKNRGYVTERKLHWD